MSEPVLEVKDLVKNFAVKSVVGLRSRTQIVQAVSGVSFDVHEGETLGLVGESGSGKTTVGRCVLRLIEPTGGTVVFKGTDLTQLDRKSLRQLRRELQIVFQDPYASLDPKKTVGSAISEALEIQKRTLKRLGYRLYRHPVVLMGLGPAYLFLLAETLARAGVAAGLPEDLADRIAAAQGWVNIEGYPVARTVAELTARGPDDAAGAVASRSPSGWSLESVNVKASSPGNGGSRNRRTARASRSACARRYACSSARYSARVSGVPRLERRSRSPRGVTRKPAEVSASRSGEEWIASPSARSTDIAPSAPLCTAPASALAAPASASPSSVNDSSVRPPRSTYRARSPPYVKGPAWRPGNSVIGPTGCIACAPLLADALKSGGYSQ